MCALAGHSQATSSDCAANLELLQLVAGFVSEVAEVAHLQATVNTKGSNLRSGRSRKLKGRCLQSAEHLFRRRIRISGFRACGCVLHLRELRWRLSFCLAQHGSIHANCRRFISYRDLLRRAEAGATMALVSPRAPGFSATVPERPRSASRLRGG